VYEKRTESPLLGNGRSSRSVVDLFSRLLNELGQLVDQKLALFRAELRDQFATAARNAALFAIGGVAAGLGFVYLGFALAFWLGELIGTTSGGFATVGGVVTLVGGILLFSGGRHLRQQRFVPEETVQELRRDVEWIKHEL